MVIFNEMKHVSPAGAGNQQLINTHAGNVAVFSLSLELLLLLRECRRCQRFAHKTRVEKVFKRGEWTNGLCVIVAWDKRGNPTDSSTFMNYRPDFAYIMRKEMGGLCKILKRCSLDCDSGLIKLTFV